MQIRDAEGIVGQVLVDGRREARLTAAGEVMVRAARQVLQSLELAEVELKARMGVAAGTLDVVAITTAEYFVPHLLAEFGRRYPEISFRLTVANREHVRTLLQEQRCDVAIMGQPPRGLDLRRIPFAPHRLSFVARPDHRLAGRKRIPPAALTELGPEAFATHLDAWFVAVQSTGSDAEKDIPAYAGAMKEPTPSRDISQAPPEF